MLDNRRRFPACLTRLPLVYFRLPENVRRYIRLHIGNFPRLYYPLHNPIRDHSILSVKRDTQLVIEGFPRSANTFAVEAFCQAQKEHVHIAHHLHVPAQIIRAVKWNIPTVVLIRRPIDAIASLILREPKLSLHFAIQYYVKFYGSIMRYRTAYVVGTFDEVTTDYGRVIRRVNATFQTSFSPFEHTDDNVRMVFLGIEELLTGREGKVSELKIARPSTQKDHLGSQVKADLLSEKYRHALSRAQSLYADLAFNVSH